VLTRFPLPLGAGIKDQDRNILTNQHLLLSFFRSAAPYLTEGPSRLAVDKSLKVKGKPNTLKARETFEGEVFEVDDGPLDDDEEEMEESAAGEELEGEVAAEAPENTEEDIGIDIDAYLAENSNVEDLAAKSALAAAEPIDPTGPPKTQGTILVTLKDSIPYSLWNLKALATRPGDTLGSHPAFVALNRNKTMGDQPRYNVCRSFAFVPDLYPGYAHVRTKGSREGSKRDDDVIARGTGGTRTWEFALKQRERRGGYNGRPRRT
jgi:25S rRNA (uracil2634-N3)-methyltransferase